MKSQIPKQAITTNVREEFRQYLALSQVWPRRQEFEQALTKPALMKEVKRTNAVIVNLQQQ